MNPLPSPCICSQPPQTDRDRAKLKRIERSVSLPIAPTRKVIIVDQELDKIGDLARLDQEASIKFLCKAFKIVTVLEKRKMEKELNNLNQLLGGHPLALRLAIGYINRGQFLADIHLEEIKDRIVEFLEIFKVSRHSGNLRTVSIKKPRKGVEEKILNWTSLELTAKYPENELVQFIASGILKNWFIDKNMAQVVSPERREKIVQLIQGYQTSFLQSKSTIVSFGYTNHTANWMFQVACKLNIEEKELVHFIVDTTRIRMDIQDEFDWFTYLHKLTFASLWPQNQSKVMLEKDNSNSASSDHDTATNYRWHKIFLQEQVGFHILKSILDRVEKRSRKFFLLSTVEDKYLDWILSLIGHGKDLDCVNLLVNNDDFMNTLRKTSIVIKKVAEANLGIKELEALHKILLIWFALSGNTTDDEMKDELVFEGMASSLRPYQQTVKRYKAAKDIENLQDIWPIVADKCQILVRFTTAKEESKSENITPIVDLCKGILKIVDEGYL